MLNARNAFAVDMGRAWIWLIVTGTTGFEQFTLGQVLICAAKLMWERLRCHSMDFLSFCMSTPESRTAQCADRILCAVRLQQKLRNLLLMLFCIPNMSTFRAFPSLCVSLCLLAGLYTAIHRPPAQTHLHVSQAALTKQLSFSFVS